MRTKKTTTTILATLLAALLLMSTITGCAGTVSQSDSPTSSQQPESPSAQSGQTVDVRPATTGAGVDADESPTYIFTDSAGRQVELLRNLERIVPSGPLAQIVLITLCPDKLVGLASLIDDQQADYIDSKYTSLPVLGNFYADTLNLESVMLTAPQVVIDIGESKPNNNDDLDGIQSRTGIPTIFIQMEIDTVLAAYQTLGEITGENAEERVIDAVFRDFCVGK